MQFNTIQNVDHLAPILQSELKSPTQTTKTNIYRHKMTMLMILLFFVTLIEFSKAMPRKENIRNDMMVKENENVNNDIQTYIMKILDKLTDARKKLFMRKLWIMLHCRNWRKVKVWSYNGPWINNEDVLARIL